MLADGFPGRRAVSDATEPARALEEERRLAYVAWTRARRSLTLLYDPEAPSPFLREAFAEAELAPAPSGGVGSGTRPVGRRGTRPPTAVARRVAPGELLEQAVDARRGTARSPSPGSTSRMESLGP